MLAFAAKHILCSLIICAMTFFWLGFFIGVIMSGISDRECERFYDKWDPSDHSSRQ